MAPAVTKTVETQVFISRIDVITDEDISYLTRLAVEVPTPSRDELDYPTTKTTDPSYYQLTSTIPISTLTNLTTIVISQTATITLTTTALITSQSTVTTLGPTDAPLLLSTSTNIVLSPGQIAGIVLGALTGLLLFVLVFYLLLTHPDWVNWLFHCCKPPEKIVIEMPEREPKKSQNQTKKPTRKTSHPKDDGKQAEPKTAAKQRVPSMLITPEQRQYEMKEGVRELEAGGSGSEKTRFEKYQVVNTRRLG
ncbi:hypothetical protein F5Y12DRAFT_714723 [Xylaria sp. FL1777]|nr:hypothetical protein F5Y12DRAFT_714723 [Xylaria sp. FL1777]